MIKVVLSIIIQTLVFFTYSIRPFFSLFAVVWRTQILDIFQTRKTDVVEPFSPWSNCCNPENEHSKSIEKNSNKTRSLAWQKSDTSNAFSIITRLHPLFMVFLSHCQNSGSYISDRNFQCTFLILCDDNPSFLMLTSAFAYNGRVLHAIPNLSSEFSFLSL